MEALLKYFPHLTQLQEEQFQQLETLYGYWNERINVISRKDISNLYLHHVLHSLSIARVVQFRNGSDILDVGTGGGFPGIPLAILFPGTHFHLIDSTAKKIKVVHTVAEALQLDNVSTEHNRAEKVEGQYDFIVSRAVTDLKQLYNWTKGKIKSKSVHEIQDGWLILKGGDISDELKPLRKRAEVFNIIEWFGEEYFAGKKVVYLPLAN